MSIFTRRAGFVLLSLALGLSAPAASAQSDPVRYWVPGSLFGFGGSFADAQKADTYGNFPSFDGANAQGGDAYLNANRPDGWFMASEGGRFGLSGLGQAGAFGSYQYQGAQVGYNFKSGDGSSPVTFFAGFDSLKYNPPGAGGPLAPFSSGTNAGYAVRGGIEYRPTSNLSLSIGASFAQPQAERMDSDINSQLLPGQSPLLFGGR
ncbi:outer membrane beta-barrel protein [Bradyrhizobium tropiciagri]|uniref:outer membrane beta-barrel protein n=1 Tax=Bradyrhizobium tropiciagri TaxID=312253 RepID=UPI0020123C82|nr:outer membrane beta-barrel protein [Bradyrhizobium tropiciagri]